jgi:hypothetical protein
MTEITRISRTTCLAMVDIDMFICLCRLLNIGRRIAARPSSNYSSLSIMIPSMDSFVLPQHLLLTSLVVQSRTESGLSFFFQ